METDRPPRSGRAAPANSQPPDPALASAEMEKSGCPPQKQGGIEPLPSGLLPSSLARHLFPNTREAICLKEKNRPSKHVPGCFGYPLSIFFIVINEFCERFSYYGMRAVLVLYFKYFLNWDDNLATAIYHTFVALCYLTPILGAIVADSWLGKFKTIVSLSIVYTVGQVVLAISSVRDMMDHDHDGVPDDIKIPIALSMIGLILIAFGTGGIKPCVAAFGGDQFEDHQEKQRSRFFSIFYLAINAGSLLSTIITPILRGEECGIHTKQKCYPLAFGVPAALMAVALKISEDILLPFVKGSRWTLQATTMDGDFGPIQIKPDQMQTVNPILIVIMVPVVDAVVYPLIKKCHINFTPLRKMTVGMLLAALAFFVAAVVQVQINPTLPKFPAAGQTQIKVINLGTENATIQFIADKEPVGVMPLGSTDYFTFDTPLLSDIRVTYGSETFNQSFTYVGKQRHTLEITNRDKSQAELVVDGLIEKPEQGNNKIRFLNNLNSTINITMVDEFPYVDYFSFTNYSNFERGAKNITVNTGFESCSTTSLPFGYGSAYTIVVEACNSSGLSLRYVEDIQANTVSMAWQIPQYFIITCAEVVFSVTGLSFSYSQAPDNMKSVLQAGWLLTVAVGNIIVLIIAGASKLSEQWAEYVLFAGLLVAVTVVFAIMAYFYTYVDPAEVEAQLVEDEKKEKEPPVFQNGTGPAVQTQL
ncbi:hypothetical protein lerEdw1_017064 [Lerista edwardsae]|nr:hypothetical protein lerEdw1_017064 [Lerista edwardsae]